MAAPLAAQSSSSAQSQDADTMLDVSLLKELAKKALVDALNSVNGAKTLVLDPSIAGPLGLVAEVSLLKQHGVDKMFWLEPGPITSTTVNVVYLCRPLINHIKVIADQIKRHARENQHHTYTLLLVPRVSTLVTRILEEEGVLGEVTISSYNLQFIPLADDVISLEYENAFKEIWVDGDETAVYNSAQALVTLEKLHGLFPRIIGKGDHAARLATLLTRSASQSTSDNLSIRSEKMDSLVIIDRRIDMVTPLLTQLTYEGLIDEVIGVKNSHVQVPAALLVPPSNPSAQNPATSPTASTAPLPTTSLSKQQTKKYHLSAATDPLLADLRDLNFSAVGRRLNLTAHRLEKDYNVKQLQSKTVTQLRDFVGKLGGLQSEHQALRLHTGLSELLVPQTRTEQFNKSLEIQQNLLASYDLNSQVAAIEDMIAQGSDMQVVLRLLCLASIVSGGIKTKALESIKREFLQAYGYHNLPLLLSLASPPLSILLPSPMPSTAPAYAKYPYASLRKSLRLVIDDPEAESPDDLENDISYVYSGYAPISVRLVQCVAQKGGVLSNPAAIAAAAAAEKDKTADTEAEGAADRKKERVLGGGQVQAHPIVGWKGFDDVVASLPGETVDIVQTAPGGIDLGVAAMFQPREHTTTTVVFFLGGCTFAEIAALRWVGRQNRGRKFLIATTGIVSGRSIIEGIAGVVGNAPGKDASL